MREIIFRAKTVFDGDWVYGGITWNPSKKEVFIHTEWDEGKVIPETVGQYTGLCDKNGKKIFEGDIVKHIQKYEISGEVKSIAVIKWNEAYSCWSVEYTNGRITAFLGTEYHKLEVIGNIHDNHELLTE